MAQKKIIVVTPNRLTDGQPIQGSAAHVNTFIPSWILIGCRFVLHSPVVVTGFTLQDLSNKPEISAHLFQQNKLINVPMGAVVADLSA